MGVILISISHIYPIDMTTKEIDPDEAAERLTDALSKFLGALEETVNRALLLDFAGNGILYDEARALEGPCKCFEYEVAGVKRLFCWAPGIIGALNKAQIDKYCPPEKRVMLEKPMLPRRIEAFIQASEKAKEICAPLPKGERLACRIETISKELRAKGIKV